MTRLLLTGNAAAAWGARLARADYVPAFPITPQTEIIETLARWSQSGEIAARVVSYESEHSMVTGAASAAATGVRAFTATSSQGLLYAMEMIYTVAGWRAPFVMVNVSRGLASPITLEPDHNDILAARDSGFLQIHCASCQEVVDSLLIAYRLAEDPRVRLPTIVNLDGFYLSFTREPVELPEAAEVDRFLPPFDPRGSQFRAGKPLSQAVAVLSSAAYSYFRYQSHLAASAARAAYGEIAQDFAARFGRHHPDVEAYRMDDAEIAFVMIGSFATKARDAVDRLRAAGQRAGLIRPRLLRPFPSETLRSLLRGRRAAAVIDQNLSPGFGGILHGEIAGVVRESALPILSFVAGLGGRDIAAAEFDEIYRLAAEAARTGRAPEPRLLFNEKELREIRKLQAVAQVEAALP